MAWGLALASTAAMAAKIDGGMPNRISMNLTVPKQTQGATFGERVNGGLHAAGNAVANGANVQIDVACDGRQCVVRFPGGEAVRADLQALQLTPAAESAAIAGTATGGAIASATVSALAGDAAIGRMAPAMTPLPSREAGSGRIDVTEPLVDGEYLLTLVVEKGKAGGPLDEGMPAKSKVVEKASSGLKDTLKTQVRMAAPSQVRIALVFQVQAGMLRVKHDTAKNSISNIR